MLYINSLFVLLGALSVSRSAAVIVPRAGHAELEGMTVFGYQGWYPIDFGNGTGTNYKWFNPPHVTPGPPDYPNSQVMTDTLPYVADYAQECLLHTNFILADGSNYQFFTSYCTSVIEAHFQYMVKYKIDGLFVQRFFDAATPSNEFYNQTLFVLHTVRDMAEKYNKFFAVEYDLSGKPADWDPNFYIPILQDDYINVIAPLFSSPNYIFHGARPVIEIYGPGINPQGLTGAKFQDIIQRFKAGDENPYIVIGIPHNWRDYGTPSNDPTGYWQAFQAADCLQPWPVGAFSSIPDFDWALGHELIPGKQQADSWGIDFSAAFTPGGSNRNAARTQTHIGPLGNRFNGTFYEYQLQTFTNGTFKALFNFGAMFDEYTEGSQILPMLKNNQLPTNPNPGFFGTDDDMDIFWYMDKSGQYTAAFHELYGQTPLSP